MPVDSRKPGYAHSVDEPHGFQVKRKSRESVTVKSHNESGYGGSSQVRPLWGLCLGGCLGGLTGAANGFHPELGGGLAGWVHVHKYIRLDRQQHTQLYSIQRKRKPSIDPKEGKKEGKNNSVPGVVGAGGSGQTLLTVLLLLQGRLGHLCPSSSVGRCSGGAGSPPAPREGLGLPFGRRGGEPSSASGFPCGREP